MVGSAASVKLFAVAAQIASAYFLTPLDYGEVAIAMTVGSIAGLFGVGPWNALLLRRPNDTQLRSTILVVGLAMSAIPVAAVLIAWDWLNTLANAPNSALLSLIVVIPILLSPFITVYSTDLQVKLELRRLAIYQAIEGATSSLALVAGAMLGLGAIALAGFRGVGACVSLLLYWNARTRHAFMAVTRASVRAVAGRGTLLSAYVAITGLLFTLPPAIVVGAGHIEDAGLLAWAIQFAIQLPMLIGVSARQVQMAVSATRTAEDAGAKEVAIYPLIYLGFSACMLQAIVAPIAVPLIFGGRWDRAIPALVLLSLGQCLLPLIAVQAGQALLQQRLKQTLAGTFAAVVAVVAATFGGVFSDSNDLGRLALHISVGYIVGSMACWFIIAWPDFHRIDAGRLSAPVAMAVALLLVAVSYLGLTEEAIQVPAWCLLVCAFIASTIVLWRSRPAKRDESPLVQ
jgi:O-antigen/teichoic acid export membrane protein